MSEGKGTSWLSEEEKAGCLRILAAIDRLARRQSIFTEIYEEQDAQDDKWGADRNLQDGTGLPLDGRASTRARMLCQSAFARGQGSWRHILEEEVAKAFAETDPPKLRTELIQCAAVIGQWIDAIDRGQKAGDPPPADTGQPENATIPPIREQLARHIQEWQDDQWFFPLSTEPPTNSSLSLADWLISKGCTVNA